MQTITKNIDESETPFIKLFTSPRKNYFFDVNKNDIVCIEKAIYEYLDGKINQLELDSESIDQIKKLKSEGYLSGHHVKTIKHFETDRLSYQLGSMIEQITLQITQSCNLCCSYCAYANIENEVQRNHSNKKMTWDIAKKGIDFLVDHSFDSKEIAVCFYGGEPMLEFDLMKKTVEYAEDAFLGKKLLFAVTTNATVLSEEMIDYLANHDFFVTVSIDGPKSIHDKNRRFVNHEGSFDKVFENLKRLVERYSNKLFGIAINMVIDPCNDYDDIEKLLSDPIFDKIVIMSSLVDDVMLKNKNKYSENYTIKSQYQEFLAFLDYLHLVKDIKVSPLSKQYINILDKTYQSFKGEQSKLADTMAPGGPCVPGQSRLFVSADGTFYPCERVSETSNAMKIGNIDDGINFSKAEALLNIGQLTELNCKNCWAMTHCILCARFADSNGKLSGKEKLTHCRESYQDLSNKIIDCILIKEVKSLYKRERGLI